MRAGAQFTNPATGTVVIDDRFNNLAYLPGGAADGTVLHTAIGASGVAYQFGKPNKVGVAGAALQILREDGTVAFDSRYRYLNVIDIKTGVNAKSGLGTFNYPAGRTYAAIVVDDCGTVIGTIRGAPGGSGTYFWNQTLTSLQVSWSGTSLIISNITEETGTVYPPAFASPVPEFSFPGGWKVWVLDTTGFPVGATSLPAPVASISPAVVTDPASTTISWTAVSRTPTANGTVTYALYYRQNGGAWTSIAKGTALSHTAATTGLGGSTLDYYVIASDNGGSSGNSNTVTLTVNTATSTLPTPSPSVAAKIYVGIPFSVTWPAVARTPTANGTVTYEIRYLQDGADYGSEVLGTATSKTGTPTSGQAGHTYGYSVRAADNGGTTPWSSYVYATVYTPGLPTPTPSAPATATLGQNFQVTWNAVTRAPSPNGTVTYKIHITDNGVLLGTWDPTGGNSNTYLSATVTSANVGHKYGYSVQAIDSGGSSSWSPEVFVQC